MLGVFDPDIHMDDIAAASRACHDEASAVDARQLAHQATHRPDLLIITDGVAIGWDASFATHVRLTFVRHGALGCCSRAICRGRGEGEKWSHATLNDVCRGMGHRGRQRYDTLRVYYTDKMTIGYGRRSGGSSRDARRSPRCGT